MNDTQPIVEILEIADIFHGLNHEQLEMIAAVSEVSEYNTGDLLFEENSASDELYVIIRGEVDIQVDPSLVSEIPGHGPLVTIVTLRRGDTFGEIALVDQGIRSASARCGQQETQLVAVPRDELMQLCESHPTLGFLLMRNLAADLAIKIRTRTTDFQMREWLTWSRGKPSA